MSKEAIKVRVIAGVILKRDDKYFLVQEKQPKAFGLWNWPAGHVDVGESLEETAVREAKEESGYDVRLIKEIAVFHWRADDVVKHVFAAEILGGEINFPKNEILDARWFTLDEIKQMSDKLRGGWVLESIKILEKI